MKQKLNAKDFILIGVLTALMWIICMVISRQSQSPLLLCSAISLLYGLNTDKSEARWIFAVSVIPCGNGYPIR